MFNEKVGLGIAAAALTGGYAAFRIIKAKRNKVQMPESQPEPIPESLKEATPEVIYERREKIVPVKSGKLNLKAAAENVRAALNLAVLEIKTLVATGLALVLV
ncbi:MAG: hypothetical protein HXX08_04050 [Chloroflexi bacterium]|uniref:Uncharacterized protein n=1 Tax=Candidatus Chlorohelix allophototropha TaxID=3003348 RepID=A0A8T7LXS1_9CHLR|nr:hypothetical protein [Chloroflexota bacterium]WJW66913.1 hypothetical protein OZ401_000158 [Chloroflexota bacterium L227-S17]